MSSLDEMYKTLTNAMKSEINTIKKEKDQWETQKKLLIKKQFQPGEIITLNVGGKIFATAIETLQQQINGKDTVLSAMFSGRFELTKDKHGNIFIDRDGTTFRYILNYLRVGGDVKKFIPPKNEQHLQELILEAEYFGLEDLKKYLKPDSFANSKILCEEYISKLHEWIGARKNWQLCYQGTRDGFSASDFHAKCNNKGETVTVIKSTGGWIFGGYTPIDWTSRGGYAFDSRTFLFTLKNNTGTQMKLKNNGPHQSNMYSIYDSSSNGPTFGGGHDIFISSGCNANTSSYSNLGHSFSVPGYSYNTSNIKNFLAGSYNFQVSEIEVFVCV